MKSAPRALPRLSIAVALVGSSPLFAAPFVRGDANGDGTIDISDAVATLGCLFLGTVCPDCLDAADSNDDGQVNIGDPTHVLNWLFRGGPTPPSPSPNEPAYDLKRCGFDPTPDGLGCEEFRPCGRGPAVELFSSKQVYTEGEEVRVTATLSSDRAFKGTFEIEAFETDQPQGPESLALEKKGPISLAANTPEQQVFTFTPKVPGHFVVLGRLFPVDLEEVAATDTHDFGVRPGSFPASVPISILKAEIAVLDVADLGKRLAEGSDTGRPVELSLGSRKLSVRVKRRVPFDLDPDSKVPPALQDLSTFKGFLVDANGKLVPGGAVLTVSSRTAHIMLRTAEDPKDPESEEEILWVEPLSAYEPSAPKGSHLIYKHGDTVTPPDLGGKGHHDPLVPPPEIGRARENAPAGEGNGAGGTLHKTVRLKVFEHEVDDDRTDRRCSIVYTWEDVMTDQFVSITPRVSTDNDITVDDVLFTSWSSISSSGYGNDCSDNLSKFRTDHNGVDHRVYVLFTTKGTDCGGIAFLGTGTRTDWHALIKDTHSFNFDVMVLGQEVGHNLDWHDDWSPAPHDAHLDVSERWNHRHGWWIFSWDHRHCTIMRGSYDNCEKSVLIYKRNSNTGRRHLAEGLSRYF